MQQRRWCVVLSVACVLLVFCAVRTVKRPAASDAAQRIEVGAGRAQADDAIESMEANHVQATNELQLSTPPQKLGAE